MNPKATRFWILVAAGLFAFIFFYQRHAHKHVAGPLKPLPELKADAITSVIVRTQGQVLVHAELTNRTWQITEPIADLANGPVIEFLLHAIEQVAVATYIPARELNEPAKADEEFGFAPEAISLLLQQGDHQLPLLKIGRRTNPGDQVFVQVAGDHGVYVLDAGWLNYLPKVANAWRDPTLVNLTTLAFDHIAVTNSGASFVLEHDRNRIWHMTFPIESRADNSRIMEGMSKLHYIRATQFVPDGPKPELEAMGLAPPEFEVGFNRGATNVALLQFGKTNGTDQVYARCLGRNAIFTVPAEMLTEWQHATVNDFRDRLLLALPARVEALEIRGEDTFGVQHETNGSWRVLPQNFPADPGLVGELLSNLTNMPIVEFFKDVVTTPGLPEFGLATPALRFLVFGPGFRADGTNALLADLHFGTNKEGKVFARWVNEAPKEHLYVVNARDFARLPTASWQLRERRVWTFPTNDITGVTIHHLGKTRQIVRHGAYKWSLATQGMINDLAVEETVRGLAEVRAVAWTGRGSQNRARFGFTNDCHQISIELKTGDKATLEFGGDAPSGRPYAAVTLGGDLWIFEFPLNLFRHVLAYLTIPAGVP